MKTVKDALSVYLELNTSDRMAFYLTLTSQLDPDKGSIQDLMQETRFKNGVHCPHCESLHIVKNGCRKDGTQRYLCRDCRRSFLLSTDSIISGTHKDLSVWKKYFRCMLDGKTLKDSAEYCGISTGTAFLWRHKILDTLTRPARSVCLSGTVEADETYTPVSYKGNHTKSTSFTMPRETHHRGKSVHTKGLSSEQVCILSAVNASSVPISGAVKTGKISSDCVNRFFDMRLHPDTVLCTDNEKAYRHFSRNARLELVQMDTDKRIKGKYGIQRINAYHSRLKEFFRRLKGVATKYLNHYLAWHDLMFCSARGRQELERILPGTVFSEKKRILCRNVPALPPVPGPA